MGISSQKSERVLEYSSERNRKLYCEFYIGVIKYDTLLVFHFEIAPLAVKYPYKILYANGRQTLGAGILATLLQIPRQGLYLYRVGGLSK